MEWLMIVFLVLIFAIATAFLLAIDAVSAVLANVVVSLSGRVRRGRGAAR